MEILFYSRLDSNTVITKKKWPWHDSCVVVACTKNCCDLMTSNEITAVQTFHWIWNMSKTLLVERAPSCKWESCSWSPSLTILRAELIILLFVFQSCIGTCIIVTFFSMIFSVLSCHFRYGNMLNRNALGLPFVNRGNYAMIENKPWEEKYILKM